MRVARVCRRLSSVSSTELDSVVSLRHKTVVRHYFCLMGGERDGSEARTKATAGKPCVTGVAVVFCCSSVPMKKTEAGGEQGVVCFDGHGDHVTTLVDLRIHWNRNRGARGTRRGAPRAVTRMSAGTAGENATLKRWRTNMPNDMVLMMQNAGF